MGGNYGCGCKEVYRFPHITYLYLLFLQHPYFLFIKIFFLFVLYMVMQFYY